MKPLAALLLLLAFSPGFARAQSPTVVELYQSQGCSSCPPAIRNVNAIADRQDVLALIFAVTYWDKLGWKDTFAKASFTERQYDYAHGLHHQGVYTPQVVIDGRFDIIGTDALELAKAIEKAGIIAGPSITENGNSISVSADGRKASADVWLVRYDPRTTNVAVGAGENGGAIIAHKNVVRELTRLGSWHGEGHTYPIAANPDISWRSAILIQGERGGQILAAKIL